MHFGVRFVSCIRYVFFFVVIYFFRIADWKSHSYKFINKSCSIFSVLSEPFCWIYIFFLFLQFQLSFKCSGSSHSPPSTLDSHVDPHTGVQLQEVTATISKDLVFEYFGKSPFKCDCHAWSPRGKAKSQSATIEVACKWSSCCFFFLFSLLNLCSCNIWLLFRSSSVRRLFFSEDGSMCLHMKSLAVMGFCVACVWFDINL